MSKKDEIEETNPSEIEALIGRIESGELLENDRRLQVRLLRLILVLLQIVQAKNGSISKLKRLLFGPRTDKRQKEQAQQNQSSQAKDESSSAQPGDEAKQTLEKESSSESKAEEQKQKKPGHGRLSASDYVRATVVVCENEELKAGDKCPDELCRGHLRDTKNPNKSIRLVGHPMVEGTSYEQQVLSCTRCEARFVANLPAGVPPQKYDETADVAIAMAKYGSGLPFYRIEKMQSSMGIPLPASTQFERCEAVANAAHPVYLELERQAANSNLLHGDDTSVKILDNIKENKHKAEDERKGMHTTGVGARSSEHDIALFVSGCRHCGENLAKILKQRSAGLEPPIFMADAESKNWSEEFECIVAKCLTHGRRKFSDIEMTFPSECGRVLDDLAAVYKIDAQTKGMTPQERLVFHQAHSLPIMNGLKQWLDKQLSEHLVEPNSSLGKAFRYMQNHWEGLTKFLTQAGAPLDNNFVERILKRAVLHRKNALFYKTEHGAQIGDIIMSLIETCALNHINPFDYLVALMRNAVSVRAHPKDWLPWNYPKQKLKPAA